MGAKAGEIARENAAYRCVECHRQMAVMDGRPIPNCPHCGADTFQTGWRTLDNQPPPRYLTEALL